MVVRAREGERLVSVKEAQVAMGLPATFSLPGPRSRAFRLLAGDACVPIIRALVEEIQVWLY
jgi:hypothetical protein